MGAKCRGKKGGELGEKVGGDPKKRGGGGVRRDA